MSIFNVQIFTFIEALTKSNQYYCFMLNNHSVDTFYVKTFLYVPFHVFVNATRNLKVEKCIWLLWHSCVIHRSSFSWEAWICWKGCINNLLLLLFSNVPFWVCLIHKKISTFVICGDTDSVCDVWALKIPNNMHTSTFTYLNICLMK